MENRYPVEYASLATFAKSGTITAPVVLKLADYSFKGLEVYNRCLRDLQANNVGVLPKRYYWTLDGTASMSDESEECTKDYYESLHAQLCVAGMSGEAFVQRQVADTFLIGDRHAIIGFWKKIVAQNDWRVQHTVRVAVDKLQQRWNDAQVIDSYWRLAYPIFATMGLSRHVWRMLAQESAPNVLRYVAPSFAKRNMFCLYEIVNAIEFLCPEWRRDRTYRYGDNASCRHELMTMVETALFDNMHDPSFPYDRIARGKYRTR